MRTRVRHTTAIHKPVCLSAVRCTYYNIRLYVDCRMQYSRRVNCVRRSCCTTVVCRPPANGFMRLDKYQREYGAI